LADPKVAAPTRRSPPPSVRTAHKQERHQARTIAGVDDTDGQVRANDFVEFGGVRDLIREVVEEKI
jgi:hypothetical protein